MGGGKFKRLVLAVVQSRMIFKSLKLLTSGKSTGQSSTIPYMVVRDVNMAGVASLLAANSILTVVTLQW